ncbi:MAG TPA: hypothetical protein VFQ34_04620 [Nitrospiraceae bacterium]|jgi:hypothetical protein|nr:hypothetical protein [Nitrospiraceae bacterium]
MNSTEARLVVLRILVGAMLLAAPSLWAGTSERDPSGFHGIRWGANLAEVSELTPVQSSPRIVEYELKAEPPQVDGIPVEQLRFVSIEDQFARVAIRYSGSGTHSRILEYLQARFGPIDRTPGSMLRGMSQQYNWRGEETEANLTYDSYRQRGAVFIESRTLAPRFNDMLPEGAY